MLKKFFSIALLVVAVASGSMFAHEGAPVEAPKAAAAAQATPAASVAASASVEAPKAVVPAAAETKPAAVKKPSVFKRAGASVVNAGRAVKNSTGKVVGAVYNFAAKQHPFASALVVSATTFALLYKYSDKFHNVMSRCGCNKPRPRTPEMNCGCNKPKPAVAEILN